jgi:hypothetical protein
MFTHEVMVRVASLYGEYGLGYPGDPLAAPPLPSVPLKPR